MSGIPMPVRIPTLTLTHLGHETGESKQPLIVRWQVGSVSVPEGPYHLSYATSLLQVPVTVQDIQVVASEPAVYFKVDRACLPAGFCHLVLECGSERVSSGKFRVERSGL